MRHVARSSQREPAKIKNTALPLAGKLTIGAVGPSQGESLSRIMSGPRYGSQIVIDTLLQLLEDVMTRILALLAALMLLASMASIAAAQDDNAQRNEASSDSSQDVVINQNCRDGAICNANVGAPEPATQVQANSAQAEPEPPTSGGCAPGLELDTFAGQCYNPALEPSWGEVFGIAASAIVIIVGIVLMWATRPEW